MKLYILTRNTVVYTDINTTWNFFSDPRNLSRITPADVSFVIQEQDKLPVRVHTGLLISYVVKPLFGIPLRWLTEIRDVTEPRFFIDEQKTGPYASWHHEHYFEPCNDGKHTLMSDMVTYSMPLGIIGRLANKLVVANKLEHIFDYREKMIAELFPSQN